MNVKVFIAAVFLIATNAVFAHAMLEQSSPAKGEVLRAAPKQIALAFGHPVKLTQFKLVADDKKEIAVAMDLKAVATSNFAIPIPELAPGKYQLTWGALSSDGHAMRGILPFSINKDTNAP